MERKIRGAVIGYGGSFNMGKKHAGFMQQNGIEFAAVCDMNPERVKEAEQDFPGIRTFTDVKDLLAQSDIDLVTVITPHNAHAPLAKQVLESGKHCITEKPMCISADDAQELIRIARDKGLMLSVYHNRRWDAWYVALKEIVSQGTLGDIYHVEMFHGGYSQPKTWWRSYKDISGGILYDWGAHYLDWLLGIMPGKVKSVRGFAHKLLFHEVTNEDQADSIIHFENGAVAHLEISSIAYHKKPSFRILGTKGAFVRDGQGMRIMKQENGEAKVIPVEQAQTEGPVLFYANIADHLRNGTELIVRPEQARRVIAIIDASCKSAEEDLELPVPYEDDI
jgi:predicted dehydrogenase